MEKTNLKTRIHDGIVGMVNLGSIIAVYYLQIPELLFIPAIIAILMILSMFTGLCPVYLCLNCLVKNKESQKS